MRLPESTAARAVARARYVVQRRDLKALRDAAQAAVQDLVLKARQRIPADLPAPLVERLVNLSTFVAHARTGVQHEGTGKYRVILGVPTPEEPTRLVGQLTRLARCTIALGLNDSQALELATKVALDSVPLARMRVLGAVIEAGEIGASVRASAGSRDRGSDARQAARSGETPPGPPRRGCPDRAAGV